MRAILALRHAEEDLQGDAHFEPVVTEKDQPFVYRRGNLMLAVNPAGEKRFAEVDIGEREPIFTLGMMDAVPGRLVMGPQSFVVLK